MPTEAFALQPRNPELHCQPEEINFVDWVFNAAPVLKERAEMMALHEGMTYEQDAEMRTSYAHRSLDFIRRITDTLSNKMVKRVKNRWGDDFWPWERSVSNSNSRGVTSSASLNNMKAGPHGLN